MPKTAKGWGNLDEQKMVGRECMNKDGKAYRKLQQHLNRQAVGFPATRTGADIKLLKHIFSPMVAEIAACLDFRSEPLETIFERAKHLFKAPGELAAALDRIHRKGGIHSYMHDGKRMYANVPLVIGMYETQINKMTPEFVEDFNRYTGEKKFGVEFLATDLPQMRTIPVARSIEPDHRTHTFDEVLALLEVADSPIAVLDCICRKKKAIEGHPCKVSDRKETCLALGEMGQSFLMSGRGREISRQEARSITAQNQKDGLVLQVSNTKNAFHICACCGCCCGFLDILKNLPEPLEFWSSNFHAAVDEEVCEGCGVCAKRCQMGAVAVASKDRPATVNRNICIGCGLCVPTCPKGAIRLDKNEPQVSPPDTRKDLYDVIMTRKKGRWGKLKVTGKILVGAVRTGRTDLLKR
jgi:electron transport complex protein RnfB